MKIIPIKRPGESWKKACFRLTGIIQDLKSPEHTIVVDPKDITSAGCKTKVAYQSAIPPPKDRMTFQVKVEKDTETIIIWIGDREVFCRVIPL